MAIDRFTGENSLLFIRSEQLFDNARSKSLWYVMFGIACCAIEGLMHASASRYDFDRMGVFYRSSPRQSDVMIVAGTVNLKMAEVVRRLYDEMPEPKYVVAFGSCACSGGPFREYPNVLLGVDKIVPVDVYVPGCPPRPESAQDAFMKLMDKIKAQTKTRLETREKARKGMKAVEVEQQTVSDALPKPTSEAVQEAAPKAASETSSDTQPDAQPEAQPEVQPEAQPDAQPEAQSEERKTDA